MAGEGATDKRLFSIRMSIETIKKAERAFGKAGDASFRDSITRAVEEATRSAELTAKDYREIAEEIEQNINNRMMKRSAK